ncbi:MAG: hypothetical protein NVS3B16_26290 [Vulcanimicrobiaceae bacterium]
MKRGLAIGLLYALLASPAFAADRPLALTIEGRPVARSGTVAMLRGNVAYADIIELVRSYGGLVTFKGRTATATIHARTASFVAGRATALLDGSRVSLPRAPFTGGGTMYVPLVFFVTRVAGGSVRVDAAKATARIAVGAGAGAEATAGPAAKPTVVAPAASSPMP